MKFPPEILKQCWFIAGPTAVGKTELGIELAQQIGGEIVSLDSMAIYREMDIGTAKPTEAERERVPHHLIDIVSPDQEFSTAEYVSQALSACELILSRGKVPIFLGGTGLYLRAVLRGVFEGPPADWEFRRELQERAHSKGRDWMFQELERVDPESARRLHPNDQRRVIRALEIFHLTGKPASAVQNEKPLPPELRPEKVFWLHPDREWLYQRINCRVETMMELGLVEEVRGLLRRTPPIGHTARQALGYREMIDWMEGRLPSENSAVEKIQTGTRQFAKRQHTWFRNLEECRAVSRNPHDTTRSLLDRLFDEL